MKKWMHKIEVIVDKLIPFCLVVLLFIIIIELGFEGLIEHYHLHIPIIIADGFVVGVFVADLIFKYIRTRKIKEFARKYWLDILAVFPFFLIFRIVEVTAGAFSAATIEGTQTAQKIVHEGLEVEKEGVKIIKEAERFAKLRRSERFARFIRPLLRIPRFLKALPKMMHFYERPTGGHHVHDKTRD
jgi:hypothetical protein